MVVGSPISVVYTVGQRSGLVGARVTVQISGAQPQRPCYVCGWVWAPVLSETSQVILPLSSQQLGLVTSKSTVNPEIGFCRGDVLYRTHRCFINNHCNLS